MNGCLVFDRSPVWLALAALFLPAAGIALRRSYRRASDRSPPKLALALKGGALAILLLCLFEPLWSSVRATPGANLLIFLADDSQSLTIADETEGRSRGDVAAALLDRARSPWLAELERQFDVRCYAFGSRLRSLDGDEPSAFGESESNLAGALSALRVRFAGAPVAGIVLVTDGNATDIAETGSSSSPDVSELPPIHPVALGGRVALPDLAVRHVAVTQTAFEDAPVTIRAEVSAHALSGWSISIELLDESDHVAQRELRTIGSEHETIACEFRPGGAGVRTRFYRVRAIVEPRTDGDETVEATLSNNVRTAVVERSAGPHRILYVAGRPNWEFKFLNRAAAEDDQLDLVALVRIARRSPKLQWRDRDGSGNRLFRNFDDTPDPGRERYDEPVLVRLNARDPGELARGFPGTAEELFSFDAVIIDDLEAEFLTHDQIALLRRFVAERGGSLLMLGGPQTFSSGGWERTAIADVLPVHLDRRGELRVAGPQRLDMTREGLMQPWVRLRGSETEERARLAEMPPFLVVSETGRVRPGARALLETVDEAGRRAPALVVHRYGHGRSAALTVGDLWRWQLRRKEAGDDDLGRAWRQTLRWLVADVPERVRVEIVRSAAGPQIDAAKQSDNDAGAPAGDSSCVTIRVHVRDAEYRPLEQGSVRVTIEPPDGTPLEILAEPSLDQPGAFDVPYLPPTHGAHRVRAVATDAEGDEIDADETGWAHEPDAAEFARIEPDRKLLETLAERTGGRVLSPRELAEFARALPATEVPRMERTATPLWHRAWVFGLVVGCLAGEWGLRRRRGLR